MPRVNNARFAFERHRSTQGEGVSYCSEQLSGALLSFCSWLIDIILKDAGSSAVRGTPCIAHY